MKWMVGIWMGMACGMAAAQPWTVFEAGKEGYHTFRIPAVVLAKDGGLLAFCEARKNDRKDHGDIDLVVKRSGDAGKTWSTLRVLHDGGGDGPVTMGNPAPVVDETGKVHLVFCRNNSEVLYLSSDDHGATWSEPKEITQGLRKDGWGWYATGPGHGIQLSEGKQKGRIIIPANHRFGAQGDDKGSYGAHSIFSDDSGKTWQLGFIGGEANGIHPNENTAAELPAADGRSRVLFNVRNNKGENPNGRAAVVSVDGGQTVTGDFTAIGTIDAPACQGSSLRGRNGRIFFTSPRGKKRENLTLWISSDEGKTWIAGETIHAGPAAYADIVEVHQDIVGVLFENGVKESYERISFQNVLVK
ncbi:MAG TPA: sialidase family protein [Luteolibacter sp.]|nr:sialidase family protein [Luteolibacter sp.]